MLADPGGGAFFSFHCPPPLLQHLSVFGSAANEEMQGQPCVSLPTGQKTHLANIWHLSIVFAPAFPAPLRGTCVDVGLPGGLTFTENRRTGGAFFIYVCCFEKTLGE